MGKGAARLDAGFPLSKLPSSPPNPMTTKIILAFAIAFPLLATAPLLAADSANPPAPAPSADHVGFPEGYAQNFQILRVVNKEKEGKIVTVYGNTPASSVTNAAELPYPDGSVIVMETATALKGPDGKLVLDDKGNLRRDKPSGLHVMRRGRGLGEAYGPNRTADWEYVEYRPDGARDYVYRGRLPASLTK